MEQNTQARPKRPERPDPDQGTDPTDPEVPPASETWVEGQPESDADYPK